MKINNIKINGFGKFENRDFNFAPGINVVYGNNESGKTTFSKCLSSMFYGISRTKDGNFISDYDKYTPWSNAQYSAKINYSLDNGNSYEVFRDFSKRNVKIYNSRFEDISSNYSIDKARNSNFFAEQTNISEDIFTKLAVVRQDDVKLNKLDQHIILQKISNFVSTGDDSVSYNKLIEKLNKKQLDEVGTKRSTEKPINIVLNKIDACNSKLLEFNSLQQSEKELKRNIDSLKNNMITQENEILYLKDVLSLKDKERIFNSKADTIRQVISEYDDKIEAADTEIAILKRRNKKFMRFGFSFLLLCLVSSILYFIFSLPTPCVTIPIIFFILGMFMFFKRVTIPDVKDIFINSQIEKADELDKLSSDFENTKLSSIEHIRNKYGNDSLLEFSYEELKLKLNESEGSYSDKKLEFNSLNLAYKELSNKLDNLMVVQEELDILNSKLDELQFLDNSINLAKSALTEAYNEMKNNITPGFTENLSNCISKISNGKYSKIHFNDENGLIAELPNGDFINCELLSIGTIDQMYIALRLSALKQISHETLPILLDEAFVYFDADRLKNILNLLNREFSQIIIFSCSSREMDLLNSIGVQYNKLTL